MSHQAVDKLHSRHISMLRRTLRRFAFWSRNAQPRAVGSNRDSGHRDAFSGGYNEAFVIHYWTGYSPRH